MVRKPDSKVKQAPVPVKSTHHEDFDLLDELLSPAKPKQAISKTTKEVKSVAKDDIDSFFD